MENSKFLQNFRPKNNTLGENFKVIFLFKLFILIQAWHSKIKIIILLHKIVGIS
jgi:hypothetical protein